MNNNSKLIAKNTVALYIRMLFLMIINLFTSRVVLSSLGIEDYGIYNVVGGFVSMFAIVSQSLSTASSRFISYELGRDDKKKLKKVFTTSFTIQVFLALLIAIIAEIVGIWFVEYKMVMDEGRQTAATWLLHFSIISFSVNLISVPYNAAIISHQRMSAFAYIGIYEGISKLIIAFMLMYSPIDKLIFYGSLILLLQLSVSSIYFFYCKKNFIECKSICLLYDKGTLNEMLGYAGWNTIGSAALILRNQGNNILLNLFFGPAVNAARSLANQVNYAITSFSNSFTTAVNPQITQSYSCGDIEYMRKLVYQGAKYSSFLNLIISLPVLFNIDYLLNIWLIEVPSHTLLFVRLTLIYTFIESLSTTIVTSQLATGKVKSFQLTVGLLMLLNLPISYLFLKMGAFPEIVMIVAIVISVICLYVRMYICHLFINSFSISEFYTTVVIKVLLVATIASIPAFLILFLLPPGLFSFIASMVLTLFFTCITILFVGCKQEERIFIKNILYKHFGQNKS